MMQILLEIDFKLNKLETKLGWAFFPTVFALNYVGCQAILG